MDNFDKTFSTLFRFGIVFWVLGAIFSLGLMGAGIYLIIRLASLI